jgi:hypothetical protein
MAYDSMPPRPDCEFNFVLPFGIDTAEGLPHNDNQGPDHPAREPHDDSNSNKLIGAIPHTDEQVNTLLADDEDNAQQPLNDGVFRIGFSDDEGVREAFDLSWSARQARQGLPKNKKSSRRSGVSDDDDETIPRIKRARRSIFGGPVEKIKEKEHEDHDKSQDKDMSAFDTLKPDIRQRMSSLNLVQQDTQSTHASNSGFGLQSSEKDSLSSVSSRAPSEESIIIPPDDKVGCHTQTTITVRAHISSLVTNYARTLIVRKQAPTLTLTGLVTMIRPRKFNSRLLACRKPNLPSLPSLRERMVKVKKRCPKYTLRNA